jgi:hypothetical protein
MHEVIGGRIHKRNFVQTEKSGIITRRFLMHLPLAESMRVKLREMMRANLRVSFHLG